MTSSNQALTAATAGAALNDLDAAYNTEKAKIVAVIKTHIQEHAVAAAQHQAEVDAATALITKADPGASPASSKAAAFMLTAPTGVAKAGGWLANNWRYVIVALCIATVTWAVHTGWIKF